MHLIGVKEEGAWLISRWNLTYRVGWDTIVKGVSTVYELYEQPEVLMDGKPVEIGAKEDILKLPERGNLCIRGISKIIKVPIMITFYNQLAAVDVNVAQATDEFKGADYERFNHSLCQYMDSIELAMYR
ncbi:MAG: hypothetical protein K6G72_05870 [Lachnospiraceae bacterium]|nr:hypothetical protein [Lachnospiraceae bacterium]